MGIINQPGAILGRMFCTIKYNKLDLSDLYLRSFYKHSQTTVVLFHRKTCRLCL